MKKALLAMGLCLSIALGVAGLAACDLFGGTKLTFTTGYGGDYIVTGLKKEDSEETIEIPSEYKDVAVTKIGNSAFQGYKSLKSVTIPDSVTSIGEYAFAASGIESITIPDTVTTLGKQCFFNCTSLKSVTIGSGVKTINLYTFAGSSVETITLGKNVQIIWDEAFRDCTSLKELVIPNSVHTIGASVFEGCTALNKLTLPDTVTTLDSDFDDTALYADENNWKDGVFYIGNYAITAKDDLEGEVTVKDGTKAICDYAFAGIEGITKVTLPEGLLRIGNSAFERCKNLAEINIPTSVEAVGESIFDEGTAYYNSGANWYDNVLYVGDVAIRIRPYLPSGDRDLNVSIKEGTRLIADEAFGGCLWTRNVEIPASVERIGYNVFKGNPYLEGIRFADRENWHWISGDPETPEGTIDPDDLGASKALDTINHSTHTSIGDNGNTVTWYHRFVKKS